MQQSTETPRGFRFGVFEVDLRAGEVHKDGRKVKLQEQPFQVLAMLLERAGQVVTREEIQKKLWAEDTFVDFEHGLNIAINKIREALGDSADNPRFVETIPKRGYRFIAPVLPVVSPLSPAVAATSAKDGNGLPDMAVVRIELGEALTPTAKAESAPAAAVRSQKRWQPKVLWGASGLALLALASVTAWYLKPTAAKPVARLTMGVSPAEQLTGLNCPAVALSPEGNLVAFVGSRGGVRLLYVRALDGLEAKALPGTEGIICTPFFSPDGQWLGFYALGKLKKVSIHGGAPVTLMNSPGSFGASWGSDDTIVFADISKMGLTKIYAAGGAPQEITTVDPGKGETSHRFPAILPGGKALLFTVEKRGQADEAQIVAQRLDTGERRVLIEGGTYPNYVPTGHLVYVRAGTLMAAPFDPERLVVIGASVLLGEDVWQASRGAAQFAVSSLGSLVYIPGGTRGNDSTLVWVDRKGMAKPLPADPRNYGLPVLSPDGTRLALQLAAATYDIWLYEIARDGLTRLTFESNNEAAIWSPDGKRIAFCSSKAGSPYNLFWKAADGSGPAEPLIPQSKNPRCPDSWSPDGKHLVFTEHHPTNGYDIWVLSLDEEHTLQPLVQTQAREYMSTFSPDGRWLAYVSDESGRSEVYAQPFPGPGEKRQISVEGGVQPRWARNGRELFYRNGRKMMVVDVQAQPTFRAAKPRLLFEGNYKLEINATDYDVSPDGQRFLMLKPSEQPPATQISVVLNWFEDLKRRVPAGN